MASGLFDLANRWAVRFRLDDRDAAPHAVRGRRRPGGRGSAPGGVLGVIGLHRARSIAHLALRGALGYPASACYRLTRPTAIVGAPILDPSNASERIRMRSDPRLMAGEWR